jgi:hypothetical protein
MSIAVDNNIDYKELDASINNRRKQQFDLLHVVSTGPTTFTCVYSGVSRERTAFVPLQVEGGRGKTRNKREKKRTTRRKR